MQTYLINLSYAKDRYQTMQHQLANLGIPFAAICAVDGKQLALPHPDFAAKSYQLMHGKEPNMGELGCYLSHIKALKALLATQHEHALILEDDAVLQDDFGEVIAKVFDYQQYWDIVRLSGWHSGLPLQIAPLDDKHTLCVNFGKQTGSAAYIINRHAAANIIRHLLPMKLPYDHAFDREWLFASKALFITPPPAKQGYGTSYIWSFGIIKLPRRLRIVAFAYRFINEILRVFCRGWQALRLKFVLWSKTRHS